MRAIEWTLRVMAVVSLATSLVWLMGTTGTGLALEAGPVRDAVVSFDRDAAAGSPSVEVEPDEDIVLGLLAGGLPESDGLAPGNVAELSVDFDLHLYELSLGQRAVVVALRTGLALGVAWVSWSLAALVAEGRRGDPFTPRRLRSLGLLVAVGAPAYAAADWLVHRWLVSASELASRVTVPGFGWREIPWVALAAGLALLVLASVWRRGVVMRHELEGLV